MHLSINLEKTEYLISGAMNRDFVLEQGTIKSVDYDKYLGYCYQY